MSYTGLAGSEHMVCSRHCTMQMIKIQWEIVKSCQLEAKTFIITKMVMSDTMYTLKYPTRTRTVVFSGSLIWSSLTKKYQMYCHFNMLFFLFIETHTCLVCPLCQFDHMFLLQKHTYLYHKEIQYLHCMHIWKTWIWTNLTENTVM